MPASGLVNRRCRDVAVSACSELSCMLNRPFVRRVRRQRHPLWWLYRFFHHVPAQAVVCCSGYCRHLHLLACLFTGTEHCCIKHLHRHREMGHVNRAAAVPLASRTGRHVQKAPAVCSWPHSAISFFHQRSFHCVVCTTTLFPFCAVFVSISLFTPFLVVLPSASRRCALFAVASALPWNRSTLFPDLRRPPSERSLCSVTCHVFARSLFSSFSPHDSRVGSVASTHPIKHLDFLQCSHSRVQY